MPNFRELTPPLIAVVFVTAAVALVFELLVAGLRGKTADPVAVGVLGTIIGACVPALVALYLSESKTPPAPPPPGGLERTGDPASDHWNEEHGWLQMVVGKWMPC